MSFDITNPKKPTIPKDPNAILDYSEDWTDWLLDVADTISSVTLIVSDPLSTLISDSSRPPSHNGLIATCWLKGGRPGTTEVATYRITTVAGRVDDRSLYFKIADR